MAYSEQTSIADAAGIILRIANFAASAGWTVERNDLAGANRTVTIRKPGVTDYIHIYNTAATSILMRISVGYDGLLPPPSQPNVSGECLTSIEAGPYPKLFLFAGGDWLWVAIGVALSGEYRHMAIGMLDKAGAYDGGTYIDGSHWGGSSSWASFSGNHVPFQNTSGGQSNVGRVRADSTTDGRTNFFFTFGVSSYSPSPVDALTEFGNDTGGRASASIIRADDNAFSGRSVFHPLPVYVARTGSTTYYSPIGVVPGVRLCSTQKFEPEQEVTIGTDVYKVFPCVAKRPMSSSSGVQPGASGDYGYAVRKIA